jgi:ABC-2 type transport system permease protein
MGVGLLAMGLPAMLAAQQGLVSVDELTAALPSFGLVALFLAFFVLGYFLYSALYAAVGAMCSSEQEAQQAQLPVVMLLVVPIVVLSTTLENPDTGLMSGLSLVPFFSPILMFARAASGAAPAWHIGLSLVLMAATIGIVAWVAGRIYRVGILMQGKRPSVPELWRWVREG